jgi:hypothetical protein
VNALEIEPGDVVLLGDADPMWAGCLLRVEEVRSWGVIGSVVGPQRAEYPLRVAVENIAATFQVNPLA